MSRSREGYKVKQTSILFSDLCILSRKNSQSREASMKRPLWRNVCWVLTIDKKQIR